MEEDIGRGVFEQAEEIGGKRRTREAIRLQGVFEVFTRLLCFGADADLGPGSAGNMGSNHGEW
jgi:hypothetical protein